MMLSKLTLIFAVLLLAQPAMSHARSVMQDQTTAKSTDPAEQRRVAVERWLSCQQPNTDAAVKAFKMARVYGVGRRCCTNVPSL